VTEVVTIDFHVTSECNQECPYCWGPQGFENPVDTSMAVAILEKIAEVGARRIVFTGGDPLLRPDIAELIRRARDLGLEVALSTTGDELTREFLEAEGECIDLISLPLDGSSEAVSCLTKKEGHFAAVMRGLGILRDFPAIDLKIATPVTRHNIQDVPKIVRLLENLTAVSPNRLFYNVFQAFPRAMEEVTWDDLLVTDEEFADLRRAVQAEPHSFRINWLSHEVLDRLYVMIFPDGTLTVPSGPDFLNYGPFIEVDDLAATLARTDFDAPKHQSHSKGWGRSEQNH
jgi:MoaA/NifB/PqqE/SkfB family radical SAM enzyme